MGAPDATSRPGRPARRLALLAVPLVLLLLGGIAWVVTSDDEEPVETTVAAGATVAVAAEVEGDWPTTTTSTTTTTTLAVARAEDGLVIAPPLGRPYATDFLVADATGPGVALFSEPDVPVPSGKVMENPTWEGLPLTFLVRERDPSGEWLRAQLMSRPNSAMAWIRRSDVELRRVPNHILIERGANRLTVFHGEEVVFQTQVATGKASSPTPLGTFFVDGVVRLSPPHRSYGTGQLSFSGFSEVYESFGGGVGQVAMHGTQNPALIGTPASNGCVRMRNADIDHVTTLAPTGTPVEVIA